LHKSMQMSKPINRNAMCMSAWVHRCFRIDHDDNRDQQWMFGCNGDRDEQLHDQSRWQFNDWMFDCNGDHDERLHNQLWWQLWSTRKLTWLHDRSRRINRDNVHACKWLKQSKQEKLAWLYQLIDEIDWRRCLWEGIVSIITSKETHMIEAIDWWYQLRLLTQVNTVNGDEDHRRVKRGNKSNNQLSGDHYVLVKCKDTCTYNTQKVLLSLDWLTN
jgi:hypothetical protein